MCHQHHHTTMHWYMCTYTNKTLLMHVSATPPCVHASTPLCILTMLEKFYYSYERLHILVIFIKKEFAEHSHNLQTEYLKLPFNLFLSRLNLVQKETMWSLILYVVCSMYVVFSMYVVCGILQNWSLYPHTLMYSHGTWTQWSLGRVTHVTSTDVGSKVI